MKRKHRASPWLTRTGSFPERYGASVSRTWCNIDCLRGHFQIPSKPTRLRFVRGKDVEALRIGSDRCVSGHRDGRQPRFIAMYREFLDWFGRLPGYVYVEYEE